VKIRKCRLTFNGLGGRETDTGSGTAMRLKRRTVLGGMMGAAALGAPTILRAQTRELVMIGYGNEQDQPLMRAGEELSRRHPGVSLTIIGGLSTEALAQIRAARGNSPYDLAVMGSPAIVNALAEEVLEPMDLSLIPNAAGIAERFLPLAYETGCPITFEGIGIAYNMEAIDAPPATWEELWNPAFAGRVGMVRPQSNLGPWACWPRPPRPSGARRPTWPSPSRSGWNSIRWSGGRRRSCSRCWNAARSTSRRCGT
jgi:hypothetical protein